MFDTELFIIEVNKEESIWNISKFVLYIKKIIKHYKMILHSCMFNINYLIESKMYHDRVEKHVSWRRVGKAMFNDFENLTEKEKETKSKTIQKFNF